MTAASIKSISLLAPYPSVENPQHQPEAPQIEVANHLPESQTQSQRNLDKVIHKIDKAYKCEIFFKIVLIVSTILLVIAGLCLVASLLPNASSIGFISFFAKGTMKAALYFGTTPLNLSIFAVSITAGFGLTGVIGICYNKFKGTVLENSIEEQPQDVQENEEEQDVDGVSEGDSNEDVTSGEAGTTSNESSSDS